MASVRISEVTEDLDDIKQLLADATENVLEAKTVTPRDFETLAYALREVIKDIKIITDHIENQ